MLRTSIHACGTATTTLRKAKAEPVDQHTRSSAFGIISRKKSSPVTPRWIEPCARWLAISEAEVRNFDSEKLRNGPAIVAAAARLYESHARPLKKAFAFSCSRPFDGTPITSALIWRPRSLPAR